MKGVLLVVWLFLISAMVIGLAITVIEISRKQGFTRYEWLAWAFIFFALIVVGIGSIDLS